MATLDQLAREAADNLHAQVGESTNVDALRADLRHRAESTAAVVPRSAARWRLAVSAAAVVVVLAGLLALSLWTPAAEPTWDSSPNDVSTTVGSVAPSTTAATSSSVIPTVTTAAPTTEVSVPLPTAPPPVVPQPNLVLDIASPPFWSTPSTLVRCQQPPCQSAAAAPNGSLVIFDPQTSQLNVGFGPAGPILLTVDLGADAKAAHLVAVGPQSVAYLAFYQGGEDPGDVVAVATEGDRAGKVVARVAKVTDPSGDSELVATRQGLVVVGCCSFPEVVPDPAAEVVVPWVDNDGTTITDEERAFVSFRRVEGGFEVHRTDPTGPGQVWTMQQEADWRGIPSSAATVGGNVTVAWDDVAIGAPTLLRFKTNGEIDRIDVTGRALSLSAVGYAVLADDGEQIYEWAIPGFTSPADATDEIRAVVNAAGPADSMQQIVDRLIAHWTATSSCENPTTAVELARSAEPASWIDVRESCDDSVGGARYVVHMAEGSDGTWDVTQAVSRWLCIRSAGGDACV